MNGRTDREMDGTRMVSGSGEAGTRRQIEGFWRVSAVSSVANREERFPSLWAQVDDGRCDERRT